MFSTVCGNFRRRAAEESTTNRKSGAEVGNQPACVYDCYSTGSGYQLSHHRRDDVTTATGNDVIVRDGSRVGIEDGKSLNCCTNQTASSQVLYQPYIGSVV